MTPPVRNNADRQRIANRVRELFAHYDPVRLREALDLAVEDGMKAASYDGDGRGGGDGMSFPERVAVNGYADRACEALERHDRALRLFAEAESLLYPIVQSYDPPRKRKPGDTDDKRKPGKGKAPADCCQVCWSHGAETPREGDFALWCNTCGRFKRTHGERPTNRALWEIIQRRGYVTSADLSRHAPHLHPDRKASA